MSLASSYNSGRFSVAGSVSGHSSTSGHSRFSTDTGSDSQADGSKLGYKSYRDRTQAWWSVGDFLESGRSSGITHKSAKFTLTGSRVFGPPKSREDVWDITDSLAEIYEENFKNPNTFTLPLSKKKGIDKNVDPEEWLSRDTSNGFIRVYTPDMDSTVSQLVPCTLGTSAHKICVALGISVNALHVQTNGDIIRRVDPYEHPLAMQNEFLAGLGFTDIFRIQKEGSKEELGTLIRFYSGKPFYDSTFARNKLQSYVAVKKGKMMSHWSYRLCSVLGTRLMIHKDKLGQGEPMVIQLAKGHVEGVKFKGHEHCMKLTLTQEGEKVLYLSFTDVHEYNRWFKKCKKATDKLPTSADLSNCHLEYLPETIFINDQLVMLNLRHNVLRERPVEDDIYTIGWLNDLSRFTRLRSLNLADNNLDTFPVSLCMIRTLVELNIASNRISEIPAEIGELKNLQALHVHNNHLTTLPDEMLTLHKLFILVLAFNHFKEVPMVVAMLTDVRISEIENMILAGNQIQELPAEVLMKMKHVKKVDFRMNQLTLSQSETMKFTVLEHLTHLDIRDNDVHDLDIRSVKTLEYLNCERNSMSSLQLNGMALKNLHAGHNCIEVFSVNPKPEWLVQIDVSHNKLKKLPDWLSECFFLQKMYVNHNQLIELPSRLFTDTKKLKVLRAGHNNLLTLPSEVDTLLLEELHVQANKLVHLPNQLLIKANKLKVLNATKNRLTSLPPLNELEDLNKVQELYLSMNQLTGSVLEVVCAYPRLKVLHLAHNEIQELDNSLMQKLEVLHELNVSGNQLRWLPECLGKMSKLVNLRAHSNMLQSLPDLKGATALRVLDVGHNRLIDISVTNLMASQLNLLDMSLNTQLRVDPKEFKHISHKKTICVVDLTGQNRKLPGLDKQQVIAEEEDEDESTLPWKVGIAETSGIRNKLCVASMAKLTYRSDQDALFGIIDGGRNNDVPKALLDILPKELRQEKDHNDKESCMKYAFLAAHRGLQNVGTKLGASVTLCHLERMSTNHMEDHYVLQISNVGGVEAVMGRDGEAVVLTRNFSVQKDKEECLRVCNGDGTITEDGKVNGTTPFTRLLGSNYLYPHVLPIPHVMTVKIQSQDEFILIANQGLWKYLSYSEAVEEIYNIGNPVVAAKRLQDLAQGYGSKENIGILVVRLNTDSKPSLAKMRRARSLSIDDVQAAAEYEAQKAQKLQNMKPVSFIEYGEPDEVDTPMSTLGKEDAKTVEFIKDNISIDGGKVPKSPPNRSPKSAFRPSSTDEESIIKVPPPNRSRNGSPNPPLKPLPNQKFRKKNVAKEWEEVLQKRLTEDVKDKEMKLSVQQLLQDQTLSVQGEPDSADELQSQRSSVAEPPQAVVDESSVLKPSQINPSKIRTITPPAWTMQQSMPPNPAYSYQKDTDESEIIAMTDIDRSSTPRVRAAIALFENMQMQTGFALTGAQQQSAFSDVSPTNRQFSSYSQTPSHTHSEARASVISQTSSHAQSPARDSVISQNSSQGQSQARGSLISGTSSQSHIRSSMITQINGNHRHLSGSDESLDTLKDETDSNGSAATLRNEGELSPAGSSHLAPRESHGISISSSSQSQAPRDSLTLLNKVGRTGDQENHKLAKQEQNERESQRLSLLNDRPMSPVPDDVQIIEITQL